jgi:hypothetical protein
VARSSVSAKIDEVRGYLVLVQICEDRSFPALPLPLFEQNGCARPFNAIRLALWTKNCRAALSVSQLRALEISQQELCVPFARASAP